MTAIRGAAKDFWNENFIKALLGTIALFLIVWGLYHAFNKLTALSAADVANINSFVSIIVLIVTFWAILWYTLETKDLKELQQKQIDLSLAPVLIMLMKHENGGCKDFIKNIGKGVANNIEIDNFVFEDGVEYEFDIESRVLGPDQSLCVYVEKLPSFIAYINYFGPKIVQLKLSFENVEGDRFKSILEIANGRTRILKQEKVVV